MGSNLKSLKDSPCAKCYSVVIGVRVERQRYLRSEVEHPLCT